MQGEGEFRIGLHESELKKYLPQFGAQGIGWERHTAQDSGSVLAGEQSAPALNTETIVTSRSDSV